MNIGVDIRSLLVMSRGGIPHYTRALLAELAGRYPGDQWHLLQTGRRAYRLPPELRRPNVTLHHLRRSNRLLNARAALTGRPRLDRIVGGVDVWFSTGFGFLSLSPGVPLVLTVHDLSFRTHPEWYDRRSRAWHRAVRPRTAVGRANRLIAVSEQTKSELTGEYGVPAGRISVIHPGIESIYRRRLTRSERQRVRRRYRLPDSYILYVGAGERRKNLPTLLEGYRLARERGLTAELVLAGRGTEDPRLSDQGSAGVRRLGYVAEADLPALYGEARLLALLSWYEGFGFPPLEALACGTPSVVSDLPIFRETLGPAARRVAPGDAAALADSLVQLDGDTKLRQRLVTAGTSRLSEFTWPRAARETYRVLKEAADAR